MIKSSETRALEVMRVLQLAANQKNVSRIFVDVAPQVAAQVLNEKRARLHELESLTETTITIRGETRLGVDQIECRCEDAHERSLPAPR